MPEDFGLLARPIIQSRLAPRERLNGVVAAVQKKTFGSQLYAIGVTDQRLVVQPVGQQGEATGDPLLVIRDAVAYIGLDGAPDGWWTAPTMVLDATDLTLKLLTRDRQKLKLKTVKRGRGVTGSASAGRSQEEGILALAEWVRATRASR